MLRKNELFERNQSVIMSDSEPKQAKFQTPLGTEDDPYSYRDAVMFVSCTVSLCIALIAYAYCMKLLITYHEDYAWEIVGIVVLIMGVVSYTLIMFNFKLIYPWIYKDILLENRAKMNKKKE